MTTDNNEYRLFPWSHESPIGVEGKVSYANPNNDSESRRVAAHNHRADAATIAMLTRAGLPKVVRISETRLLSKRLDGIHAAEPARLGSEYLYELSGEDFGTLLPADFASRPVWYIKLAPERSRDVENFLQILNRHDTGCAKLYSVWSMEAHHIFYSDPSDPLKIWVERDRIWDAFKRASNDGYVLLAFDCGGDLSLTACLIDGHLYGWGHAQGVAPGDLADLQAEEQAIEAGLVNFKHDGPREAFLQVRDSDCPSEPPAPLPVGPRLGYWT